MSLMNLLDKEYKAGLIHPKEDFPLARLAAFTRETMAPNTGAEAEVPATTFDLPPSKIM